MAKKEIKEWQKLRKKLLENFFLYRDACEIDKIAVWPKNMAKFTEVSEQTAACWLKGSIIPSKTHITKIKAYYKRLEPLPEELPEETKEYLQELLRSAEGILKTLKRPD
ncbi:MAG: hypothetical protein ISS45_07165 [Candidatus Omnitrophica bacterium]|nr:hypothetical protein [Candidatus Omnitrophota bacterium]